MGCSNKVTFLWTLKMSRTIYPSLMLKYIFFPNTENVYNFGKQHLHPYCHILHKQLQLWVIFRIHSFLLFKDLNILVIAIEIEMHGLTCFANMDFKFVLCSTFLRSVCSTEHLGRIQSPSLFPKFMFQPCANIIYVHFSIINLHSVLPNDKAKAEF